MRFEHACRIMVVTSCGRRRSDAGRGVRRCGGGRGCVDILPSGPGPANQRSMLAGMARLTENNCNHKGEKGTEINSRAVLWWLEVWRVLGATLAAASPAAMEHKAVSTSIKYSTRVHSCIVDNRCCKVLGRRVIQARARRGPTPLIIPNDCAVPLSVQSSTSRDPNTVAGDRLGAAAMGCTCVATPLDASTQRTSGRRNFRPKFFSQHSA
jgi:hypothetical protein